MLLSTWVLYNYVQPWPIISRPTKRRENAVGGGGFFYKVGIFSQENIYIIIIHVITLANFFTLNSRHYTFTLLYRRSFFFLTFEEQAVDPIT